MLDRIQRSTHPDAAAVIAKNPNAKAFIKSIKRMLRCTKSMPERMRSH